MDKLTEVPLYIIMMQMSGKLASNSIHNFYDKIDAIYEEEFKKEEFNSFKDEINILQKPIVHSTKSAALVYKNDNKNKNENENVITDPEDNDDSDSDSGDSDDEIITLDNELMTGGGKYNIADFKSTDTIKLKRLITHIIRVGLLDKMHDFSKKRNKSWHGPTNGVVRGKDIIYDMTKIIKAFELEHENTYNFENIYDKNSNPPDEQEVKFDYLMHFGMKDKIKYYTGISNMTITNSDLADIKEGLTEIIDVENIRNMAQFKTDFSLGKTAYVYDAVLPKALNHLDNASSEKAICLCNIWDSANQGAVIFGNLYENKPPQGFSLISEITINQNNVVYEIYNLVNNNNTEYPYDDIYMRMFDNKLFRAKGVKIQLRIAVNTEKVCGVAIIITKEDYTDIYNSGYKYKRDINGDDFLVAPIKSKTFFVSTGFSLLELSNCLQLLDTFKKNTLSNINNEYNQTLIDLLNFLMTSMNYNTTSTDKALIIGSLKMLLLKFKFSGDQGSILTAKLFDALFVSGDALASVAGCAHGVSTIGSVYCGTLEDDTTITTDLTLKNVFLFSSVPITTDNIIAEIVALEKEINAEIVALEKEINAEINNNNPVIRDNVLDLLGTIKELNKTMKAGITNNINNRVELIVDIKKIEASDLLQPSDLSQSNDYYDTLINYRIELITYQDNISILKNLDKIKEMLTEQNTFLTNQIIQLKTGLTKRAKWWQPFQNFITTGNPTTEFTKFADKSKRAVKNAEDRIADEILSLNVNSVVSNEIIGLYIELKTKNNADLIKDTSAVKIDFSNNNGNRNDGYLASLGLTTTSDGMQELLKTRPKQLQQQQDLMLTSAGLLSSSSQLAAAAAPQPPQPPPQPPQPPQPPPQPPQPPPPRQSERLRGISPQPYLPSENGAKRRRIGGTKRRNIGGTKKRRIGGRKITKKHKKNKRMKVNKHTRKKR